VIVMASSVALLVVAVAVWIVQSSGDPSADLVGATQTTVTTTSTTTTVAAPPSTSTTVAPPGEPVGMSIPSIGVDSVVIPVGLEPNGEMEVPPADQAGWYFYGPRPGEADGTSVIAAHVDFGGQRGVFFNLRELQVGAEVSVTDAAGATHRYVVTERYQVDKDQLPIEEIFVPDGPPGLTLITCGGSFDRSARSYQDNIVVRTVPA
jgi:LPXTG-site transpeptidase (sortase) family protein